MQENRSVWVAAYLDTVDPKRSLLSYRSDLYEAEGMHQYFQIVDILENTFPHDRGFQIAVFKAGGRELHEGSEILEDTETVRKYLEGK